MTPLRKASLSVTLCGLVLFGTAARAEVAAYTNDSAPDGSVVILQTDSLTDDGGPWPSIWQRHSDGEDTDIRVLNDQGATRLDGNPSIAVHPASRVAVAVWAAASATGYDLVVSRFVDGSWTAPQILAAAPADELDPQLVVDRAGATLHVVYWVNDVVPRVELREASLDASSWSAPSPVTGPADPAARPHAIVHETLLTVVYERHPAGLDATPRQIVLARRENDLWTSQVVADVYHAEPNRPEIHVEGARVWIEWIDGPGEVRWTTRSDGSSWTPLEVEPFDGPLDREYHVRGRVKAAVRAAE